MRLSDAVQQRHDKHAEFDQKYPEILEFHKPTKEVLKHDLLERLKTIKRISVTAWEIEITNRHGYGAREAEALSAEIINSGDVMWEIFANCFIHKEN
jgi:hypothetical protein